MGGEYRDQCKTCRFYGLGEVLGVMCGNRAALFSERNGYQPCSHKEAPGAMELYPAGTREN